MRADPATRDWNQRPEVPMNEDTLRKLARLAERASTADHKISPMQLAARLLEEAVATLPDE
jgi:hypothetical protein